MRLNKYIALASGMSRRAADDVIAKGQVLINDVPAALGQQVETNDVVTIDGKVLSPPQQSTTIIFNKPVGYVCSRDGQGHRTVYELLPEKYRKLKTIGRLDKYSSGLLLLTDDGTMAYKLTHPSFQKQKSYLVQLDRDLTPQDFKTITKAGVPLKDGPSKFDLDCVSDDNREWKVTMSEGRNRQIRRTFEALKYDVKRLHRTSFGDYQLGTLKTGEYQQL